MSDDLQKHAADTAWTEGPIAGCRITPMAKYTDARGWLAEFFRRDELDAAEMPVMGYLSMTHPGVARGPHEHADQTEARHEGGAGAVAHRIVDPLLTVPGLDELEGVWTNREVTALTEVPRRLLVLGGGPVGGERGGFSRGLWYADPAPTMEVMDTDYGVMYGAGRLEEHGRVVGLVEGRGRRRAQRRVSSPGTRKRKQLGDAKER